MKIKDLIKELKEYDENLDVCIGIIHKDSMPWSTMRISSVQYLNVENEEDGVYIEGYKPKSWSWDMK